MAAAALVVLVAYLGDRVGISFTPPLMFGVASVGGTALFIALWRLSFWNAADTVTFATIVSGTFAWLLWIARPTFFPLGHGPDLTHHLLLINYIETHWRLVHDARVGQYLGEMVLYTPGSHILTALAGAWSNSSGLHAMHAVMAASVALKAGFVFLIAMRILPRDIARVPIAALASISLFASQTYFLGSFAEYSFLAQVIAECFAVALWWTLTVWDVYLHRWLMGIGALIGSALFLTWPILIGPPLVVLSLLVVLAPAVQLPPSRHLAHVLRQAADAAIAVVPIAMIAVIFSVGRTRYLEIAGTGGEAVSPMVRAYGWWFLVLSTAGIAIAGIDLIRRRVPSARTLTLCAFAILLQAGGLYLYARHRGNDPYMARKMFYMLLYPQAVGVTVTVGTILRSSFRDGLKTVPSAIAWGLVVVATILIGRPLFRANSLIVGKRPAASLDVERAGLWARQHVDPHCIEYLVGNDDTAYWLHLAVLGNPRRGSRTADSATYELTPALVRWLAPSGMPYAIAELRAIPSDIRDSADILARFGSAAVIKRRSVASCSTNP